MNLVAGWASILVGFAAGAVAGLQFAREDWLGGYGSWRRRMVRLGHIAFIGLGILNIAFALTVARLGPAADSGVLRLSAVLLVAGNAAMPTVCYLAAWRQPLRHLFPIPVTCLVLGTGGLLRALLLQ